MGRWVNWINHQTVNLAGTACAGSSPALPTIRNSGGFHFETPLTLPKGEENMKCDTCIHGELCIYRAGYEELNMRVKAALPPEGKAPFSAEANCKHYKEEKPLLRENIAGGITGPNTHFYGYNRDER
jgi:hypothetical protein